MDAMTLLEQTLATAVGRANDPGCPPTLCESLHYAVFPGGHRIRPRLALAVSGACGNDAPLVSSAAAGAIELLHCASLIHDDLPCFDDADTRRGKPSVHKMYGEQIAVLAGDGLIVMAFELLARHGAARPARLAPLVEIVASAVGVPRGIVAGQAWESEKKLDLANYQQEKTGALFAAATMAGAASAGYTGKDWRILGLRIGEAYQVADDIRDVVSTQEELGKPVGQDVAHNRPNVARALGLEGAVHRLEALVAEAVESIPDCPGREQLRALMVKESQRFLPKKLRTAA